MPKICYIVNGEKRSLDIARTRSVFVEGDKFTDFVEIWFPEGFEDMNLDTSLVRVMYKTPTESEVQRAALTSFYNVDDVYRAYTWNLNTLTNVPGNVSFAICLLDLASDGQTVEYEWHTTPAMFSIVPTIHGETDAVVPPDVEAAIETQIQALRAEVSSLTHKINNVNGGLPTPVSLASEMVDISRLYLYTGSETGMQHGYWYYYDRENFEWTAGAQYGAHDSDSVLDETSTNPIQNKAVKVAFDQFAADAKKARDEISGLKEDLNAVENEVLYATSDITQWGARKGYGINSSGRYGTKTNSVGGYAQVGDGYSVPYILKGSSVTVNAGYKGGIALWDTQPINSSLAVAHRLEWDSTISEGETYTFEHDGYLVFQCAYADDSAISEDISAADFAAAALTVNLYVNTVKNKIAALESTVDAIDGFGAKANTGADAVSECLVWGDNILPKDGAVSGILNDDETIGTSATYYTSVYFPIKPNTTYINRTSGTKAHFYDFAKRPISIQGISATTFTTPANAVYARITSNVARSYWQINEGTELLEYSKGFAPYLNVGGGEESEEHSEYYHGPYDIRPCDFTAWYSGQQADYTVEGFSRTTSYAEVITAFDALMALDPQYITKNTLGTASGADAGGNAYTLYEYVFKPKNYTSSINTKKVPKIYMDGSIHGFEKCSTFGLYFFLKDLITNWNKNHALEAIRRGVELHVIPVSNPYGFDRNLYKNGNDVNINRNFDHPGDWIVVDSGSDQNGLAAFDQPESAIIRDWILADEANMLCYMNLHTNGQWNASGYGEMNACMTSSDRRDIYFNRIFRAFCDHIEAQTLRWTDEYDSINPSSVQFCGKIQAAPTDASTKGTASAWADTMRRIVAMTLEGFNGVIYNGTQIIDLFSADAYKINSENIGNMVVQMLMYYAE